MPSTGTAAFTITRDGMISAALKRLRVLQEGVAANANQLSDASDALNMMLKSWATKGLKLWCYQQVIVPMQAGKQNYTIGPSGADVIATRPLRVLLDGNFIRQVLNGVNYDTPLRLISRSEYMQFGVKSSTGVPNSIYYHPGIDAAGGTTSPSTGYGTLYVFVTAVDATRTIYLNAQRPIYDMSAAGDEFDLPAEWFLAIQYGLMAIIADDYDVDENRIIRITQLADRYLSEAVGWSTEEASTTFSPDLH
jgi:hypothetical protein